MASKKTDLLAQLEHLNAQQLRRLLVEQLTQKKLGLNWESNAIDRDAALNANIVLPRINLDYSHWPKSDEPASNLIIEGDNFDSLRLLNATHRGKIRVIYIDPPYNTGNKDWVYNDRYVGANDRWRHSQWLEFLYRRLSLARDLLTPDGVIMISINDENRARLELLMDEVMPGRRVGSFVWRTRQGSNDAKGGFLSLDHEHVLIYANDTFEFRGSERDETKYSNPDNDPRGDWGSQMLIKSHNAKERPEAFYPIHNLEKNVWYLCDPDSVWRFSSTSRPLNKKKLQSDPIEVLIEDKRILWPVNEEIVTYSSEEELRNAIKNGTAPKQFRIYLQLSALQKLAEKDVKIARLLTYIEPLTFWIGKKLGFGRPRYKRFRDSLQRDTTPLSSWLSSQNEQLDDDEILTIEVGNTAEGTSLVSKLLGDKNFPYPKPLSLIKGLLSQASKPGDIVLDFFAGSGTTGQAVLELNAEDNGQRRFILCSSTEANSKEPNKNLCRDVCAERLRRVMQGYGNKPGLGSSFAYLQMDLVDTADLAFEAQPEHMAALIGLREQKALIRPQTEVVSQIAGDAQVAVLLCTEVTSQSIETMCNWPTQRLVVYSMRPDTVRDQLQRRGKDINSYSLLDALQRGQTTLRA